MKKVYIAIGLHKNAPPEIIGVFKKKEAAEKAAYTSTRFDFENVIEQTIQED